MATATLDPTPTDDATRDPKTGPTDASPGPSAAEALADKAFEAELQAHAGSPLRRPAATYRFQLHKDFRFEDVDRVVGYLDELGVSDVYLSPYLAARAGSTHGYDVVDHGRINPEIGDEADHDRLLARLKAKGMGRVLDIVPNHMGFAPKNKFLLDVLENGPQARSATFFDVDWSPAKASLEGRLLLPILEDVYGKVLEAGLLELARDGGRFLVKYHDRRLPLRPRSYATVLDCRPEEFVDRFGEDDDALEYLSIRDAADRLPSCRFCERSEVDQIRREKEVIKARIQRLCERSPRIRDFLDETVASFKGKQGDARSFDGLHELLEDQVYRLASWRVASEEINYRRFFDVTELAGIRIEDPEVFDHVHRLIFQWVARGGVTGLRVDHPDGLADPLAYFDRLQEQLFLVAARNRVDADALGDRDRADVDRRIVDRYRKALASGDDPGLKRRFPIVAEKILSTGEKLPADWPIDGTVGYEYLNALNGLFVNPEASDAVDAVYREFTGDREPFAEVLHDSKVYVERVLLASEVNNLTRILSRAAEKGRGSIDFTTNDLRRVVVEVVACFRVYRTYIRPGDEVAPRDRDYIEQAVARARRRLPTVDGLVFDFVRDVLQLNFTADVRDDERDLWYQFVRRFQQTTGPVQAKGLEDTTFYRQVPLVSLNEVGGDPSRFATSPSTFHALNQSRLADWPGGLTTTATHDTKRGEDGRVRIDVISELADEWKTRLARWSRWNSRKKTAVNEADCPDGREEYLLYQTLIGAWPFVGPDDGVPDGFVERVQQYVEKAASEAKRNTTWTDPDATYKDKLKQFVADVLGGADAGPFLNDFLAFQRRVARVGVVHSLSQALLKCASPGAADVYQGCELWDLSMVDPDNRRPVDYEARAAILQTIKADLKAGKTRAKVARALFRAPEDGGIKLYLLWTALNHRKANPDLYLRGYYRPLEAAGERKDNLVSLVRSYQGRSVVAVAPRLVAGLMGDDGATPPVGAPVWGETELTLPDGAPPRWRDLLTDRVVEFVPKDDRRALAVGTLFEDLPLALLVDEPA